MDPDKQRITIAEACGWTRVRECTRADIMDAYGPLGFNDIEGCVGTLIGVDSNGNLLPIPDYLGSLDAMHEAWDTLHDYEKNVFTGELIGIMLRKDAAGALDAINASAEERAEAFLRTIGLWPLTNK